MKQPLRILYLEDDRRDVKLVQSTLEAEGVEYELLHVTTQGEFEATIREGLDVILADFTLPNYNGFSALDLARRKAPTVPFIFLSGTLGEELAIESLKTGATDYVLKQRLNRLGPVLRRAIREAEDRGERQRAEEALQRMRHQHELILHSTGEGICGIDLEGKAMFINPSGAAMLGWKPDEAIGQPVAMLLYQKRTEGSPFPRKDSPIYATYKHGIPHHVEDELFRRTDGTSFPAEYVSNPIWNDESQLLGAVVTFRDITQRRDAEEKIRALEGQFLRVQRLESIGTLASGIAHDLNNILAPILMAMDVIRPELEAEQTRKMLDMVKVSAERGSEIVKQILSFTRGAIGEHRALDPRVIVKEIAGLASDTFPKTIQIQTAIASDLQPIFSEAVQLHQVLLNLCVNARDAMLPNGGTLRIEARNVSLVEKRIATQPEPLSGPYVLITVSDTGSGIPPHVAEKIFEPFFTTKEPGKGTGLGLSTVADIVKSNEGCIEFSSEVGKGTVFTVYFPARQLAELAPAAAQEPEAPLGQGETVLLVDDEAAILEITKETLEVFNYNVLTAKDGAQAIAAYHDRQSDINVVITDMMMPHMDGATMIQSLRQINPQVKIVCVSGLGPKPDVADTASLNVQAWLTKPYQNRKLFMTLREVLDSGLAGQPHHSQMVSLQRVAA